MVRKRMAGITSSASCASSSQMTARRLPALSRPIYEHLGWVGVGLEVGDRLGIVDGMANGSVVDTVIVGGAVDVHITIS